MALALILRHDDHPMLPLDGISGKLNLRRPRNVHSKLITSRKAFLFGAYAAKIEGCCVRIDLLKPDMGK
jgi:hypothetical protein